jgi:hypothetical protein
MPRSFRVLGVSEKAAGRMKPRQKISSLEKGGISGDEGFTPSGGTKRAVFPAQKLSIKQHFSY